MKTLQSLNPSQLHHYFVDFCKYEVHELFYFLTFRKNGIMFSLLLLPLNVCFFPFGNESESNF